MGGRRARPEEKASALKLYSDGVYITEIARRTGFGTTTIFRWAQEAGIVASFSERVSNGNARRQAGREHLGKKGVFHTSKGGEWISTDSNFEQCRLEQLERDPSVVRIGRCKFRVPYQFGGTLRTYAPDFEIEFADGRVRVEEIKPARMVRDAKVQAKAAAAQEYFSKLGIEYAIVTELEIGEDLRGFSPSGLSHASPEYQSEYAERRREQKRKAQARYYRKQRATMTAEQLEAVRAYVRNKNREYRAKKRD